jgi:hypothetical protein
VFSCTVQKRDAALFPLKFEQSEFTAEDCEHILAHLLTTAKNVNIVGPVQDVDPEIALLNAIPFKNEAQATALELPTCIGDSSVKVPVPELRCFGGSLTARAVQKNLVRTRGAPQDQAHAAIVEFLEDTVDQFWRASGFEQDVSEQVMVYGVKGLPGITLKNTRRPAPKAALLEALADSLRNLRSLATAAEAHRCRGQRRGKSPEQLNENPHIPLLEAGAQADWAVVLDPLGLRFLLNERDANLVPTLDNPGVLAAQVDAVFKTPPEKLHVPDAQAEQEVP